MTFFCPSENVCLSGVTSSGTMSSPELVRYGKKRVLPVCPNPLFLQWLNELRDEAKEKGLKIQYTYQKAINSLNKYPLPLKNAKEAKILQNFGDGICKILDEKMQRYLRENGPNASIHSLRAAVLPPAGAAEEQNRQKGDAENHGKAKGGGRRKREYVPQRRSGGYAVLLTLYRQSKTPGSKGFMFKMELQTEAQLLCDKSFSVPEVGSKYTAWSSVSTLIQKNLLIKTHNPARYSLTEEGVALARRLEASEQSSQVRSQVRSDEKNEEELEGGGGLVDLTGSEEDEEGMKPQPISSSRSAVDLSSQMMSRTSRRDRLLPGTFDIVLCVDFIETTGGGNHQKKQELVKELQRNGINFDVRKLNVGDFLWVAREKLAPLPGQLRAPVGRELVLDYIIERKRMDDLCGSIIDGRFREQKFRLKRCGLRRPIYLVEECGSSAAHLSIPEATLQQAIVNTQVVDGFFVKRVQEVRESAAYLTIMTRCLAKLYQERTLTCRSRELEGDGGEDQDSLMSFAEFNHGAVKNKCQTVKEVFARQLMQISGLSGDKAAAILDQYTSPRSLLMAYEQCVSESEKEKLLSSVRYGKLKRNLGPALSRTVYQLYCTQGALS
ncbi:crossover junction endonuclease MUS81 isoform X2 [Cynoglossus semilaevis]|uniref:crossover junction endonuclease MUS81 isoform X2 n=1 Tax=Cynoglossus semilaevis TaxID=244447 RepID=UPI000D627FC5|nr:crossover junction endonuclease MUS81 isoform X2 [Cynoglossus semilaevis]